MGFTIGLHFYDVFHHIVEVHNSIRVLSIPKEAFQFGSSSFYMKSDFNSIFMI